MEPQTLLTIAKTSKAAFNIELLWSRNISNFFWYFLCFRSVVEATVLYDSSSVVDISDIQHRLYLNSSGIEVAARENSVEVNVLWCHIFFF